MVNFTFVPGVPCTPVGAIRYGCPSGIVPSCHPTEDNYDDSNKRKASDFSRGTPR
jgi:hypothetical protein